MPSNGSTSHDTQPLSESSFPMFDILNEPQMLYFCYAKGTDLACMLHSSGAPFHIVVLRGTLLMRARTAHCATQERKHGYDHGCAGACGSGPVAG